MDRLTKLLTDEVRGATSIFNDTLNFFLALAENNSLSKINDHSQKLKKHFNAMGLFQKLGEDLTLLEGKYSYINYFNSQIELLAKNKQSIAQIGGEFLPANSVIMTISYSSMVRVVINAGHKLSKISEVICLRSKPKCEGELLFHDLKTAGIKATLIEDEGFQEYLSTTDLILLGCDLWAPDFFINKTGSRSLVESGDLLNIPAWVISDSLRKVERFDPRTTIDPIFEIVPFKNNVSILSEAGLQIIDNG